MCRLSTLKEVEQKPCGAPGADVQVDSVVLAQVGETWHTHPGWCLCHGNNHIHPPFIQKEEDMGAGRSKPFQIFMD